MLARLEAPRYAFIDAYGDPDVSADQATLSSSYFVVTAVLAEAGALAGLSAKVEAAISEHHSSNAAAESAAGADEAREGPLLEALGNLDFHFYALAVDKREIRRDSGLVYSASFLKFVNGILYRTLFSTFDDIHVVARQNGSPRFMGEFRNYVLQHHIPNLFQRADFIFAPVHPPPLVHLAGLLSETLGRLFESNAEPSAALGRFIRSKALRVEEWPPRGRSTGPSSWAKQGTAHDRRILDYCVRQAEAFLHAHEGSLDEQLRAQVETLKLLLFHFQFVNSAEYVPTERVRVVLTQLGLAPPTLQYLRSNIIAKLRDQGVIIASSPKGYKIPGGTRDLADFVERTDSMVHPMLNRLQSTRARILELTTNEFDVLGDPRYEYLRKLLG